MEKQDPSIHRVLLSTTSRLIGEFHSEDLSITHAPAGVFNRSPAWVYGLTSNPLCRNHYVLSFRIHPVPPEPNRIQPIPNYLAIGDRVGVALSILFGKRFDCHGFLFSHGMFLTPEMPQVRPSAYHEAAFNDHDPRRDIPIPLDLSEFGCLLPLFTVEGVGGKLRQLFFTAGEFYRRSICIYEEHPALAYLDLVTCGEVMANFYEYGDADLYDAQFAGLLTRIAAEMSRGQRVVSQLKGRMRQIKRAFTLTLLRLLNAPFFSNPPAEHEWTRLKADTIEASLKAAYDLRSRYVHTGVDFGGAVLPDKFLGDRPLGIPVVGDADIEKSLAVAPNILGMERVMRFCLLRFLHTNGVPISPALDGPGCWAPPKMEPDAPRERDLGAESVTDSTAPPDPR